MKKPTQIGEYHPVKATGSRKFKDNNNNKKAEKEKEKREKGRNLSVFLGPFSCGSFGSSEIIFPVLSNGGIERIIGVRVLKQELN